MSLGTSSECPKINLRLTIKMRNLRPTLALLALFLILSFQAAAQDGPPKEPNKREAKLVELITLDPTIKLDIRYATEDNFVGKKV